ncbi:MAG: ribosomal L7Ae/L30e/S12e/Gadd45 family protein [Christensenellaceae bacterium]|jgi:ribosomal protein L7Ae-like RNA K-turn-binding protein|nr:ribosomal L7Ae/L30e/S12e/Gadd45 family protein [Christensenellaceae bacterium]
MEETINRLLLTNNKVIGMRQVLRSILQNQIVSVIIADDTAPHVKAQILEACKAATIPILTTPNRIDLGKSVGIQRPCCTVGFTK